MVNSGPFDGERSPASIAKVAAWLEEQGLGRPAVTYRLRDWLISPSAVLGRADPDRPLRRARRGRRCPRRTCRSMLPDDVDFRPGGESPLARHDRFVKTTCPTCGRDARRDTDTMDTFVDSSWYFFRYCSPGYEDGPFRRGGRRAVAREPVHGRCRARDPAPALLALLHEGAARRRHGAVRRAVPAADEPGPGDLRRRRRCRSRRATSSSRCRSSSGGAPTRCGSRCCSRARSRTTSTGS